MCNNYEQLTTWEEYVSLMHSVDLGTPTHQSKADLPRAANIRVGDTGPVMRAAGNVVELAPMRFGFPPTYPRSGPVFNFRSEGRHFDQRNRCLIPASAFFEFTGRKYPKAKHRFTLIGYPWLAIAGLWRETAGALSFTMLTVEPGPDVAAIHDRQVVVVPPRQWADWLYAAEPERDILRPLPLGSLRLETVRKASD